MAETGCSNFCSLFYVHCSMFIVHCSLFIVLCSMFIVHCSLFIVHCSFVLCSMFSVLCSFVLCSLTVMRVECCCQLESVTWNGLNVNYTHLLKQIERSKLFPFPGLTLSSRVHQIFYLDLSNGLNGIRWGNIHFWPSKFPHRRWNPIMSFLKILNWDINH